MVFFFQLCLRSEYRRTRGYWKHWDKCTSFTTSRTPQGKKKKGAKKGVKKVEPQPVAGIYDDILGKYDTSVSIRQVLKDNKVDISRMDLIAWFPGVCREYKRMCTRVAKRRTPKPNVGPTAMDFPGYYPQLFCRSRVPARFFLSTFWLNYWFFLNAVEFTIMLMISKKQFARLLIKGEFKETRRSNIFDIWSPLFSSMPLVKPWKNRPISKILSGGVNIRTLETNASLILLLLDSTIY